MEIDDVSVSYGDKEAVKGGLAAGPPGRGAVADRPLRLRQDDAAALAQPAHRADQHGARLSGRILLDDVDITLIEPTLLRRRVTMVFQQPNPFPMSVFDNIAYVLREQGSRRAAQEGAGAGGAQRPRPRRPLRGGQGQPRPPGPEALRRPAAAALHRPRARRRARGAAARRALLGARPAVDPGDRGPDRASCATTSPS